MNHKIFIFASFPAQDEVSVVREKAEENSKSVVSIASNSVLSVMQKCLTYT